MSQQEKEDDNCVSLKKAVLRGLDNSAGGNRSFKQFHGLQSKGRRQNRKDISRVGCREHRNRAPQGAVMAAIAWRLLNSCLCSQAWSYLRLL